MATLTDLANKIKDLPIHSVGEEWHSFTGQIPVGGVPYCGQEVTRETYADLWTWVQNKGLVKTEDEWQTLNASQNGNVPYYSSGNGSTTFRMPKMVGYIKGATSQSEAGLYVTEGLPNITGYSHGNCDIGNPSTYGGAIRTFHNSSECYWGNNTSTWSDSFDFDASRSNPIYGNSQHVTPETSAILFGVYAFGEITNVGTLDADTLATGLATLEANMNAHIRVVESWVSGTSWYRVWSDGYIEQGGSFNTTTNINTTTTTVVFNIPFKSIIYTIGGFVKSKHSAEFGQFIFQNGTTSLTQMVASTVAYSGSGVINHAMSPSTSYWCASGY